jgi:hypothetical protein
MVFQVLSTRKTLIDFSLFLPTFIFIPFLYFVEQSIYFFLFKNPYLFFVERSIFIFCGTFYFYIVWNNLFLDFVERSIPFVENDPYPLFSSLTDITTSFLCIGIRDPYADEVNGNWPFLKIFSDGAQCKVIVEKAICQCYC